MYNNYKFINSIQKKYITRSNNAFVTTNTNIALMIGVTNQVIGTKRRRLLKKLEDWPRVNRFS